MNKFFTKIAGLSLGLAMAIGVGVAVGSKETKVASAADSTSTMSWGGTETQWSFSDSGSTYLEWSHASTGTSPIQADDYRMYSGADLTVKAKSAYSSSVKIKSLAITGKSSKNSNSLFYNASTGAKVTSAGTGVTELSWSTSSSTKTASFGDGLSSVTVARSTSGNQVRVTSIVVTYEVTSTKTLSSISITTAPTKTSYRVGETFDSSGMVVTASYSDSSSENVTSSCTFSPSTIAADTTAVTASYTYGGTTKTADQSITVITATGVTEGGDMTNKSYSEGDSWDLSGLYLTVSWSGGASSTTVNLTSLTKDTDYLLSDDDPIAGHTTLDIEGEYLGFSFEFNITGITVASRPLADVLDSSSIPSSAIGTASSSWGTWTEVTDYTYEQSSTNGAKYQVRLMGPGSASYVGRMNNSTNGGFYTSRAPSGVRIKSVSFSAIAADKNVSLYVSNTAYEALPSTTDYVATLTSENLSYTVTGNYTCLAIRGRTSSLDVGALTITYETVEPVIEYTTGGDTANLTVVNGSTNTITFNANNFASVSANLFSNTPTNSNSTKANLAYSVSGTVVTITATGKAVGEEEFTISATGCYNTLTLNVTVQASTTFDSLVISTATTATEFNEDDPFAVTDMVVTANFTVGGSPATETFAGSGEPTHPLTALSFTVGGNAIEIGDPLTVTGNSISVVVSYTDGATGTTRSATAYTIKVNAYVAHTWTKVTSAPADWRGTYLLGYEKDGTLYSFNSGLTTFDATFNTVNTTSVSEGVVTGSKELDATAVKIERNTVSGTSYYHAKCANGEYLKSASKGINHQQTATAAVAVTFDGVSLMIGDYWLRFNTASDQLRFRFGDSSYLSSSTASLYKMDVTSAINAEISSFVSGFDSAIGGVCDDDGVNTNINSLNSAWTSQSTAFKALSVDAQGILACTTYTHNAETKGSTADIIDRYDYVYGKYSASLSKGDFMNRSEAGTLVSYGSGRISILKTIGNYGTIIAIIAISAVSLAAVGGYFLFRKKKED